MNQSRSSIIAGQPHHFAVQIRDLLLDGSASAE